MLGAWLCEHLYCTDSIVVVSLSADECTYCKSLWINASAKCPQCNIEMRGGEGRAWEMRGEERTGGERRGELIRALTALVN